MDDKQTSDIPVVKPVPTPAIVPAPLPTSVVPKPDPAADKGADPTEADDENLKPVENHRGIGGVYVIKDGKRFRVEPKN